MIELWIGITGIVVVWLIMSIAIMINTHASWITPIEWYDRGYNWFGAFVMWFFYCIAIAPALIPYAIYHIIRYLFTTGHIG